MLNTWGPEDVHVTELERMVCGLGARVNRNKIETGAHSGLSQTLRSSRIRNIFYMVTCKIPFYKSSPLGWVRALTGTLNISVASKSCSCVANVETVVLVVARYMRSTCMFQICDFCLDPYPSLPVSSLPYQHTPFARGPKYPVVLYLTFTWENSAGSRGGSLGSMEPPF